MTPEGKIKVEVKKVLAKAQEWGYIWSWWPVPSGYGSSALDCIGCYNSLFFAVETKAPGEKPTPRQERVAEGMIRAFGKVFVVDGPPGLRALEDWLIENRFGSALEELSLGRGQPDNPEDHPGGSGAP